MTRNQLKEGVKDQEELRVSVQEKGKRDSIVKTINCKSKKTQDGKDQERRKKNGSEDRDTGKRKREETEEIWTTTT